MKKAASARAELPTDIENPEQYDTILIGHPNWRGDLPMPLYIFPNATVWDNPPVLSRNNVANRADQVTAGAESLNLNK